MVLFKFVLLAALAFAIGACAVSERVSYIDSEGPIPEDVIKKIKKNKTEKSWVVAHLGEPFAVDRVQIIDAPEMQPIEVYSYRFARSHVRSGHLFFILRAGGVETETEYLHVAFEEGRVLKTWMDKFPRAQLGVKTHQRYAAVNNVSAEAVEAKFPAAKSLPKEEKPINWKLPILKKWFSPNTEKNAESSDSMPMLPISDDAVMKENTMDKSTAKENMMDKTMTKTASESPMEEGEESN